MLLSFFNILYELVCGANAESPEYGEGVFESVGLLTVIVSLIIALIFYIGLGRWQNIWHTRVHWVITLIIVAVAGFGVAYSLSKNEIGAVDGYLIRFALFNMLYAAVFFFLFSLFFKNFSIFSKRTPF